MTGYSPAGKLDFVAIVAALKSDAPIGSPIEAVVEYQTAEVPATLPEHSGDTLVVTEPSDYEQIMDAVTEMTKRDV